MKRMLFSGLAAVLIAGAGFSIAAAQEPDGQQPRRGGFGSGFGGPRGGPAAIARLADLTEEQRTQVRAILQEERASRQGGASVTAHRELQAEILADVPDEQRIDTLQRQLAETRAASLQREIALQRKIAQVLTPEQRAKARERLAAGSRGR